MTYGLSQRRAARLIAVRMGALRYRSRRDRQEVLRQRLRALAAVRVRFGYRRLTVLLKREGWRVNAKRIYRLYCDEGFTDKRRTLMPSALKIVLILLSSGHEIAFQFGEGLQRRPSALLDHPKLDGVSGCGGLQPAVLAAVERGGLVPGCHVLVLNLRTPRTVPEPPALDMRP